MLKYGQKFVTDALNNDGNCVRNALFELLNPKNSPCREDVCVVLSAMGNQSIFMFHMPSHMFAGSAECRPQTPPQPTSAKLERLSPGKLE